MRGVTTRLCAAAFLVALSPFRATGESDGPPPTNLRVYQILAASMVDTLAPTLSGADTGGVRLRILPEESAWALELDVAQELRRLSGRAVDGSGNPAICIDAAVVRGAVEYSGVRRDGLFGAKVADRSVGLTLRLKAWTPATGALLFAGEVSEIARDVIRVADIERLETPGLEMTRGTPPAEGTFTSLLEPLIVIGAIAVGVFLLFSVRS